MTRKNKLVFLALIFIFCFISGFTRPLWAADTAAGLSQARDHGETVTRKIDTLKQVGETVVTRVKNTGESVTRWVQKNVSETSFQKYGQQAGNTISRFSGRIPGKIFGLSYGTWAVIFFVVFVLAFLVSLVIGFITKVAWYLSILFFILALLAWFIG